MVAMEAWTLNISDQSSTKIDFWVQIKNIPLQFLSIQMVNFVAKMLGHIVETDEVGFGGSSVSGRVCIHWLLDQPLVFEHPFQFGHEAVTLTFRFEKLRNYYFRCHSFRHGIDECEVPEADAAMGHQDLDDEDVNNLDIIQI